MENQKNGPDTSTVRRSLSDMTLIALVTAVMCLLCPFAVPVGPIPVTLGVFAVFLAVYVLGTLRSAIACLLYILLGALGLPVFSGYSGSLGKLLGPTGGYIIGYVFLALLTGLIFALAGKTHARGVRLLLLQTIGMLLGLFVCYFFGTLWFTLYKSTDGMTFAQALSVCVVPFLSFDLAKIAAALVAGNAIGGALKKAHLL